MLGSQVPWVQVPQIEVLIQRACDPSLHEPNYATHLEVAEYISQKKANTPREAAMAIARLSNSRNPHIAILALALLETLVQSCGYPFHLQISTKEFLNELVRRFPERPPAYPGPVMSRILELIHSWKEGICVESRWKDDLGNIRDMHRLLTFKGYRFREMRRPAGADVAAASDIKSAEELEEEDRAAQSAKLQELIRRGTPRDLAAAQELMKSLAGANPDAKPDYRTQALTELNKLEQKVILLNEMLDNVDTERQEKFAAGDAYDQVSTILKNARPKIQKWISDAESQDSESLDTFLQINDQINTVVNRYDAFKRGDYEAARNPIPNELSNANGAGGVSLIDLDDSAPSNSAASPSGPDDLMGLFGGPSPAASPASAGPPPIGSSMDLFGNGGATSPPMYAAQGPSYGSSPGTPQQQPQFGSIMLPGSPSPQIVQQGSARIGSPSYFAGVGAQGVGQMRTQQPTPSQPQPRPLQAQTTAQSTASGQTGAKDPFADLAGLF